MDRVFITRDYNIIDDKYREEELFTLKTSENRQQRQNEDSCEFIARPEDINSLKPKDIIEIIESSLPEVTDRKVESINFIPSTQYIFIKDGSYLYGAFEYDLEEDFSGGHSLNIDVSNLLNKKVFNSSIENGYVYKIQYKKENIIKININDTERSFITNPHNLLEKGENEYDYRDDKLIIQDCNKLLKGINRSSCKGPFSF